MFPIGKKYDFHGHACGYASLLEGNNQGAVLKIPSIESIPIS